MKRYHQVLLLVPILIAALILLGLWNAGKRPAPAAGSACAAPLAPLPQALGPGEPAARAAMQSALDDWAAAHPAAASLELHLLWGEGDWAAGEVAVAPNGPGGSEGTLLLARRSGDVWNVALPGEPAFAQMIETGPADFLPPGALDWFRAQRTRQFSDTQGLYYIPYAAWTSLLVTCVDCYPGHFPSVDFYSGLGLLVRASRDGTVAAWQDAGDLCCCQSGCGACNGYLVLDHSDGEYSAYLHLAPGSIPEVYQHVGALVRQGAVIAVEGDTGYTCGSTGRPAVGCGPITPIPGTNCARHTHFEVRDAPYPYGTRLRPRFQDIYDQTDPPTYYAEDGRTYISGNTPVTPTVTPTPSPTPPSTPTPALCPPPVAPEGLYLFSEPRYCGRFSHWISSTLDLSGTLVGPGEVFSLHLAGPYTTTLYTAPGYSGTAELFLAGDPDLLDNAVSSGTASLEMAWAGCPEAGPGALLYTVPGYAGACRRFVADDPDLADDGLAGAVRSLRLVGPYSLTLYSAPNYSGTQETFLGNRPDLSGSVLSGTVASLHLITLTCNPEAEGVTLFAAADYSGTCATFVDDVPVLSASMALTTVVSLRLRGPFLPSLYDDSFYTGTTEVFFRSDPDLRDNAISLTAASLSLLDMPCRPWEEGVTLFAGTGWSGACITLRADDPDLRDQALARQVRSLHIRGPYRATLYAQPSYTGTTEVFDRSDADLSDNAILSATASLRVEAVTCTAGAGGVTLWAQPAYGGPCSTFRGDDADLADDGIGAGNAFSLRVIGPYSISLYPLADYGGTRTVVLGDLPDLWGSVVGTGTASLRVTPLSETWPLWNNLRDYPAPLEFPEGALVYVQDLGPADASPDDPLLPCAGLFGTRTLWYRPLLSETARVQVQAWGPVTPALALWIEEGTALRALGCVVGEGAVLEGLVPAGLPVLLEAVTLGPELGPLSLRVRRLPVWSVYLPLVVRAYE